MATATSLDFTRGVKPVWLVFEGDSGSGKTYLAELLEQYTTVVYRGKVTAAWLNSGYVSADAPKGVKGLLAELDQKCLVFTELGETFSISMGQLKALMGRFANMYDGKTRDQVGTRGYQGSIDAHFSMIACGTPLTLSRHREAMDAIGTRFLYYRLPAMTRKEKRQRTQELKRRTGVVDNEKTLKRLIGHHLDSLPSVEGELPPWPDELDLMVEFLSQARATVQLDEEGDPCGVSIEGQDRPTHQLNCLGLALARLYGRQEIGSEEVEKLWPVVFSSVPSDRLKVLQALSQRPATANEIADATRLSRATAYRVLKVLPWMELAEKTGAMRHKADVYALSPLAADVAPKGLCSHDTASHEKTKYQ